MLGGLCGGGGRAGFFGNYVYLLSGMGYRYLCRKMMNVASEVWNRNPNSMCGGANALCSRIKKKQSAT